MGGSADREDEVLDLLDERGRVVGRVRRGDCHGDPAKRHRAVHVFVRNSRGEYFLQKRSRLKKTQPGKWDTSVGGHIPAGESCERGAAREVEEELGIPPAEAAGLRFLHDFVWRTGYETEFTRTFLLEHEGPFRLQPEEIDDGRFWTVGEMLAAVGTGQLTPNLEMEMRLLGLHQPERDLPT